MQCIELHPAFHMTVDFPHRFLRLTGPTLNFVKDNSHCHSCHKIDIIPTNFHKINSEMYSYSFIIHSFRKDTRRTFEITMMSVYICVSLRSPVQLLNQTGRY
jgi:hypothetical protein